MNANSGSISVPTVAALNGHTFAGAMILSLSCDYRVMVDGSKRNAWMCMNEVRLLRSGPPSPAHSPFQVHFGAAWPYPFALVVHAKVTDAQTVRKIALEGHRFTPAEALKCGLVDHIVPGSTEDVLDKALRVAESVSGQAQAGAWGLIRVRISIGMRRHGQAIDLNISSERSVRLRSQGHPEERLSTEQHRPRRPRGQGTALSLNSARCV